MFLFRWIKAKSIRFRIFSLVIFLLLPICILVQFFIIPNFENKIFEERQNITKYSVQIALGTIQKYYSNFQNGLITEEEAKTQALEAIASFRYNEREYFWINDMSPTMIMHPINPKLNSQPLNNNKDPNGKFLFLEMVEVVKKDGSGFVSYFWEKPGESVPVSKISFVSGFKPWGWVIGTGLYVETSIKKSL